MLDPEKRRIIKEEKRALVFTFIDNANPYRQIDIFLSDEKLYDSLIDESMIVNFDNYPVPIVSLEQLIEMKRNVNPPREKDLSDIRQLVRIMEERNEE
jgi:predicted nucleotidyltransferase